jgi:hypothetical protein
VLVVVGAVGLRRGQSARSTVMAPPLYTFLIHSPAEALRLHSQCCGSGMFIPGPGSEYIPFRIQGQKDTHPAEALRSKSVLRSGMFIPDPNFHPGSRVKKIPDPGSGSASKTFKYFLTQKIVSKLSEI